MGTLDRIFKNMASIPKDKLLHSFYGTLLLILLVLVGLNPIFSFTIVGIIAVLKEIHDEYKYCGYDWMDILWTMLLPSLILVEHLFN